MANQSLIGDYLGLGKDGISPVLSQDDLDSLQQNAEDYIYDLEPLQSNFFAVCNFQLQAHDVQAAANNNEYKLMNTMFRVQSVSFNNVVDLDMELTAVTRMPYVKSVTRPSTITIKYLEDEYQSIRAYHKDWMLKWYNPSMDVLRSGSGGKLRGCDIVLYHYIGDNDATNVIDQTAKVEAVLVHQIRGMVPKKLDALSYDVDGANVKAIQSVEYIFSRVVTQYNPKWNKEWESESTDASKNISNSPYDTVWNPDNMMQNEISKPFGYEGNRIARSIYSTLAGEGEA